MNDKDNPGEEIIKKFLNGDDVWTMIGITALGAPEKPVHIANIIADYSTMTDEKVRNLYTKDLEEMWLKDAFREGFSLDRDGQSIRVSSKRRFNMMAFAGGHTNTLDSPDYYVDFESAEETINQFFALAKLTHTWMLHIKTSDASYLYVLDYPSGNINHKYRKDPIDIRIAPKEDLHG